MKLIIEDADFKDIKVTHDDCDKCVIFTSRNTRVSYIINGFEEMHKIIV